MMQQAKALAAKHGVTMYGPEESVLVYRPHPEGFPATVTNVLDGDTIDVTLFKGGFKEENQWNKILLSLAKAEGVFGPAEDADQAVGRLSAAKIQEKLDDYQFDHMRGTVFEKIRNSVGYGMHEDERVRIRLDHIDAPEKGQKGWQEAKDWLIRRVSQKDIVIRITGEGGYGRLKAELYDNQGSGWVNLDAVTEGYARKYYYENDPLWKAVDQEGAKVAKYDPQADCGYVYRKKQDQAAKASGQGYSRGSYGGGSGGNYSRGAYRQAGNNGGGNNNNNAGGNNNNGGQGQRYGSNNSNGSAAGG
jgi:endonuclease YncB( thermonuclease family)